MDDVLDRLQERLGYRFRQPELLLHAMTHRSAAVDDSRLSNERMEFLGDSVVGLVVCENLIRMYPDFSEGELAKLKAWVASGTSLASAAQVLELEECIVMSASEAAAGGRMRRSILADAFEALVAAVYLDSGIEAARTVVRGALLGTIRKAVDEPSTRDYKSALQERTQADRRQTPLYRIIDETGRDHEKTFTAEAEVAGEVIGSGSGASKKEAEQAAARDALERLVTTGEQARLEETR